MVPTTHSELRERIMRHLGKEYGEGDTLDRMLEDIIQSTSYRAKLELLKFVYGVPPMQVQHEAEVVFKVEYDADWKIVDTEDPDIIEGEYKVLPDIDTEEHKT